MTQAPAAQLGPAVGVCLLCCRPVTTVEPRCPAFARAGVAAHAGCCGGCIARLALPEPAADRSGAGSTQATAPSTTRPREGAA